MKHKKLVALLLFAAMALGMTGCVGDMYKNVCTIDGTEINAGLYLMAQESAFNEAKNLVEDSTKDVLKQKVEGQSASSWIEDYAEARIRKYVLVHRMCREMGIALSSDGESNLNQTMTYWDYFAADYAENGISRESAVRFYSNNMLSNQLFTALYAEGGALHVPDEQLKQEYSEQYAHIEFATAPGNIVDDGEFPVINNMADAVDARIAQVLEDLRSGKRADIVAVVEKDFAEIYEMVGREYDAETDPAESVTTAYIKYDQPDSEFYTPEFLEGLKNMAIGEYGSYRVNDVVLIYKKIPAFVEADEFESMRSTILSNLYTQQYEDYLREIYEAYEVDWVFGARWYYRPSKMKL